ncbi:hypothetical protein J0K78_04065 [Halobacillus sp. GSS1]|uniref:hypothetical protein n=1 Tax=Halobacillus sp. GSS1 TaxID=2815919 RepID=UPI001A8FB023|nr:hypothetical protein [Halobacillus sp. GSS1]MBN9653433.1 hypothetical protein [Halobacillus sp. GSS1]
MKNLFAFLLVVGMFLGFGSVSYADAKVAGWNYDSSNDEWDLNYTEDSYVGYASSIENVYSGYGSTINHRAWIYNDHNQQEMRLVTGYDSNDFRYTGFSEFNTGYIGVKSVSYTETEDPNNWAVSLTFHTSQQGEWSGAIVHFERKTSSDIWWEDFPYQGSSSNPYYHSVAGVEYYGTPYGFLNDGIAADGASLY